MDAIKLRWVYLWRVDMQYGHNLSKLAWEIWSRQDANAQVDVVIAPQRHACMVQIAQGVEGCKAIVAFAC